MTTFDLIALLITVLIVVILLFFGVVWKLLDDIKEWLKSICDKLCSTHADMYDDVGNHYLVEILNKLDNIEDNILDDLRDIRLADKYRQPTSVNCTPCYAPDGICTNPCRDCINCPKRGTCGTWSTNTSIKAEDAPLQERFNNNKEE